MKQYMWEIKAESGAVMLSGESIAVSDNGTLFVYVTTRDAIGAPSKSVVAVYAPGRWYSAALGDD